MAPAHKIERADEALKQVLQHYPSASFLWLLQAGHAEFILKTPLVSRPLLDQAFEKVVNNWESVVSSWKPAHKPKTLEDMDFTKLPGAVLSSLRFRLRKIYGDIPPPMKKPDRRAEETTKLSTSALVCVADRLVNSEHAKMKALAALYSMEYKGNGVFFAEFPQRIKALSFARSLADELKAYGYRLKQYKVWEDLVNSDVKDSWDAKTPTTQGEVHCG